MSEHCMSLAPLGGLRDDSNFLEFHLVLELEPSCETWKPIWTTEKMEKKYIYMYIHIYIYIHMCILIYTCSTALPPAAFRRRRKCNILSGQLPNEGRFCCSSPQLPPPPFFSFHQMVPGLAKGMSWHGRFGGRAIGREKYFVFFWSW